MLAAAASASRHLLQRDARPTIGFGSPCVSRNRIRFLLTASGISSYPIHRRINSRGGLGFGTSLNNQQHQKQHRTCPSLLFSVKGFLSDSSASSSSSNSSPSLHGRVPRPYILQPVR